MFWRPWHLVALAVIAAILVGAWLTVNDDGAEPTIEPRFHASGSLPPVPGPERRKPTVTSAAGPIVVIGGESFANNDTSQVPGGFVLPGGTRSWRPLSEGGDVPLISADAVATDRDVIVVGTRCDVSGRGFSERHPDAEDVTRCGAQPMIALAIDARSGVTRRLDARDASSWCRARPSLRARTRCRR